jgi:hypothetical protein
MHKSKIWINENPLIPKKEKQKIDIIHVVNSKAFQLVNEKLIELKEEKEYCDYCDQTDRCCYCYYCCEE